MATMKIIAAVKDAFYECEEAKMNSIVDHTTLIKPKGN